MPLKRARHRALDALLDFMALRIVPRVARLANPANLLQEETHLRVINVARENSKLTIRRVARNALRGDILISAVPTARMRVQNA